MTTAAVIGIGDISQLHLEAIAENPAIELVGVCDVLEERARGASEVWGVPGFTDHQSLLSELKPDVVHLSLPHNLHAPVAMDALRAGSHVLTEKPLASTLADGRRLADFAKDSDRVLGVCLQNRYNPTSVALKQAVSSGEYGAVRGARGAVWWLRTPAYYDAAPWRGTWAGSGGGAMINQSIHTLDLLCWFLGVPGSFTGRASQLALGGVIEVEDTAAVSLTHPGGVRSTFFATNAHVENSPVEIEVLVERGALRLHDGTLTFTPKGGEAEVVASDRQSSGERSYWGKGHSLLIDDFHRTVSRGERFWIDADAALVSLEVLRTVYAQSGLIPADAL